LRARGARRDPAGVALFTANADIHVDTVRPIPDFTGDVTGDGKPNVIVSSWEHAVQVLDGDAGLVLPLFADDFENGATVGWSSLVL